MAGVTSCRGLKSCQHFTGFFCWAFVLAAGISILWSTPSTAVQAPACTVTSEQSLVINYFMHDDLDIKPVASSFTVVTPVDPVNGANSQNLFGAIAVLDDAITDGPEVNSTLIARARGFYAFDYLPGALGNDAGTGLEFVFTLAFTNATDYEGSTLTFKGYDKIEDTSREIAITGGTGIFRLARGWAIINTYSLNGGAAVLNTTCYVYYGCYYGGSHDMTLGSGTSKSLVFSSFTAMLSTALCILLLRIHLKNL